MTYVTYVLAGCVFAMGILNFWSARIIRRQAAALTEAAKVLQMYLQRDKADLS